jgi:hypothetical protein
MDMDFDSAEMRAIFRMNRNIWWLLRRIFWKANFSGNANWRLDAAHQVVAEEWIRHLAECQCSQQRPAPEYVQVQWIKGISRKNTNSNDYLHHTIVVDPSLTIACSRKTLLTKLPTITTINTAIPVQIMLRALMLSSVCVADEGGTETLFTPVLFAIEESTPPTRVWDWGEQFNII